MTIASFSSLDAVVAPNKLLQPAQASSNSRITQVCANSINGTTFSNPTSRETSFKVYATGEWSAGGDNLRHGAEGANRQAQYPERLRLSTAPPGSLIMRTSSRPNSYGFVPGSASFYLKRGESAEFVINEYYAYPESYNNNYGCLDLEIRW